MDWLEEIERRKTRRETDRVFFGCYDLQRDADEEKLITEVKRLREANAIEHDRFLSALSDCQNKDFELDQLRKDKERIEFENNQFRRYVIEVGCSYTQTESDCECDYEYPWPCDHCPIVEHNRTIDTEIDSEWEIEFIR